jgi:hypothetical protein
VDKDGKTASDYTGQLIRQNPTIPLDGIIQGGITFRQKVYEIQKVGDLAVQILREAKEERARRA